jgi:predicted nucleotidyltransferase component of viral defense system
MTLFDRLVAEALHEKSDLHPLAMVVEKELLHHDILREMGSTGLLEKLTFIGGTCLRMCYGSSRLSEDLDFSAGKNFNKESLKELPELLTGKLFIKYGLTVEVSEPKRESGNVDTWKIRIVTRPQARMAPIQRINIDVCAVPSYERRPMMLRNHYAVDMGTSGLILQAKSREEILADKFIALALRPGRIKNRDLWDILWLKQQGILLSDETLRLKITDYHHSIESYLLLLVQRQNSLQSDHAVQMDFVQEMRRFLPVKIVTETVEHDSFWEFLTDSISSECERIRNILSGGATAPVFKM